MENYNIFDKIEEKVVYLCQPEGKTLTKIAGFIPSSGSYSEGDGFSHLSFEVDKYYEKDNEVIESAEYGKIAQDMYLFIGGLGYFIVTGIKETIDGDRFYKSIEADDISIELQKKNLVGFKINTGEKDSLEYLATDSQGNQYNYNIVEDLPYNYIKFYNQEDPQLSLIDLVLEKTSSNWGVGYVSPLVQDQYYTFSIDNQDIYSFLTQDVATVAECIFYFDNMNRLVNVYAVDEYGLDTGIYLSHRNLVDSIEVEPIEDNIYTRFQVRGGNNLDINDVNYGQSYVEDLRYFMNARDDKGELIYVTEQLSERYKDWYEYVESQRQTGDPNNPGYIELQTQYNQLLQDMDDIKYQLPNGYCSTDWSTFETDDLEKLYDAFKDYLKDLIDAYKSEAPGNTDPLAAPDNSIDATQDIIVQTSYWSEYTIYHDNVLPSVKHELEYRSGSRRAIRNNQDVGLIGDVNNDGYVDEIDLKLLKGFVGQTVDSDDKARADWNQDGVITQEDVQGLENYLVYLDKDVRYVKEYETNWDLYGSVELENLKEENLEKLKSLRDLGIVNYTLKSDGTIEYDADKYVSTCTGNNAVLFKVESTLGCVVKGENFSLSHGEEDTKYAASSSNGWLGFKDMAYETYNLWYSGASDTYTDTIGTASNNHVGIVTFSQNNAPVISFDSGTATVCYIEDGVPHIVLTYQSGKAPAAGSGDVNGDGIVDTFDLLLAQELYYHPDRIVFPGKDNNAKTVNKSAAIKRAKMVTNTSFPLNGIYAADLNKIQETIQGRSNQKQEKAKLYIGYNNQIVERLKILYNEISQKEAELKRKDLDLKAIIDRIDKIDYQPMRVKCIVEPVNGNPPPFEDHSERIDFLIDEEHELVLNQAVQEYHSYCKTLNTSIQVTCVGMSPNDVMQQAKFIRFNNITYPIIKFFSDTNGNVYFSNDELKVINCLYHDTDYANENIAITKLNNLVNKIDVEKDLLLDAQYRLSIESQPQIHYSTTLNNLYSLVADSDVVKIAQESFRVGNFITLEWDKEHFVHLRAKKIEYNPFEYDSEISVDFSNMIKSDTGCNDFSSILDSAFSSSSNSISVGGKQSGSETDLEESLLLGSTWLKEHIKKVVRDYVGELDLGNSISSNFSTLKHLLDGSGDGSLRLNTATEEDLEYKLKDNSLVLSPGAKIESKNSIILGGSQHSILGNTSGSGTATNNSIIGGMSCTIEQTGNGTIVGGLTNRIIPTYRSSASATNWQNTIVGGAYNYLYSPCYYSTMIGGYSNTIGCYNENGYTSGEGYGNTTIGGFGNTIRGTNPRYNTIIGGSANYIQSSSNPHLEMNKNTILNGEGSYIYNCDNSIIVGGPCSIYDTSRAIIIGGESSEIKTNFYSINSIIIGHNKKINCTNFERGSYDYLIGKKGEVKNGTCCVLISTGSNDIIKNAYSCYGIGFDNIIDNPNGTSSIDSNYNIAHCYVFGQNLIGNKDNQTVLGKYNYENTIAKFIIGTGSNNINRRNAIEIFDDNTTKILGNTQIDQNLNVDGEIKADNAIIENLTVETLSADNDIYINNIAIPKSLTINLELENTDETSARKGYNTTILSEYRKGYDNLSANINNQIYVPLTVNDSNVFMFTYYEADEVTWKTYKLTVDFEHNTYNKSYIENAGGGSGSFNIENLSVEQNGLYSPPTNTYYNNINVNVPQGGGESDNMSLYGQNYDINATDLTIPGTVEYVKDSLYDTGSRYHYIIGNSTYGSKDSYDFYYIDTREFAENGVEVIQKDTLRKLILSDGVKQIGYRAFFGQTQLDRISFPSSLEWVHGLAFDGTAWLNEQPLGAVFCDKVLYYYKGESVYQGANHIYALVRDRDYTVPQNTISISTYAFQNRRGFRNIDFYSGSQDYDLIGIGDYAFEGCWYDYNNNIPTIFGTIPSSVTWIGKGAFKGTNATFSTLPNIDKIREETFYGCNFTNVNLIIPNSVKIIEKKAFVNARIYNLTLGSGLKIIGEEAFVANSNLNSLTIPSNVQSINRRAFGECFGLQALTLPNTITHIDRTAFEHCSGLTNVTVENGFCADNLDISASTNFTYSTLEAIIDNLADRTGLQPGYFTVGSTNLAKISSAKLTDAADKNWTVA